MLEWIKWQLFFLFLQSASCSPAFCLTCHLPFGSLDHCLSCECFLGEELQWETCGPCCWGLWTHEGDDISAAGRPIPLQLLDIHNYLLCHPSYLACLLGSSLQFTLIMLMSSTIFDYEISSCFNGKTWTVQVNSSVFQHRHYAYRHIPTFLLFQKQLLMIKGKKSSPIKITPKKNQNVIFLRLKIVCLKEMQFGVMQSVFPHISWMYLMLLSSHTPHFPFSHRVHEQKREKNIQ